jgi:hypothetical protein
MSETKQLQLSMPRSTFELLREGFMPMPEIQRWTLVGGTALAIHYQHRLSEDLDFFIVNSTLEQDRRRIGKIMDQLERIGFAVTKLKENETQIDFEISGVKVTFFASGLDMLQKESISFGNVNVAGIETIQAMKMDALLNHRTLSRDFFDIATLMREKRLTIFDLLESYRRHYRKRLSTALIEERLIRSPLDASDPGLSPMLPKRGIDITRFRKSLADQIAIQAQKDTESLAAILSDPSVLENFLDRKFGLSRMNLPQKLATLGADELVLEALEIGGFDISYKDISGKTLLDLYLEDDAMFAKILLYAKEIPNEWLQSRAFRQHGKEGLIALENSVISCARNRDNSQEKIERLSTRHRIEPEMFSKRIEAKKRLLSFAPTDR